MKNFLYLILLCSVFSCKKDEDKIKTDLDKMNLTGPVRIVKSHSYYVENNRKTDGLINIQFFNKKGMLVKSIEKYFYSPTKKWHISTNIYNRKGDISRRYSNLGALTVFHKYEYNKYGLKTRERFGTKKFGLTRSVDYKYNHNNLITKEIHREEDKTYIRTYSYDSRDNPVCQTTYLDGKEVTKHYCKYDQNNDLIWSRYQNKNGVCTRSLTLNNRGDVTKEESYGISFEGEDWVEFDNINMLGFLVNPQKYSSRSTFKYDKNSNWLSRKSFFMGKKSQEEVRTIAYYDID
ncbi:MAG: hypothetical protein K0S23_3301 [Fluviicola sp.]|jgi:hypothetical protein|uniref:hypothetical protein n=1 Tax=Fluviicola sp. TaxID=1917219 RepID=UPI002619A7F6|nr:hypothetical protein [Fluviicola sp.]MDF3028994.1 hypothetical protein [Fluviicola sp.]